MIFSLDSNVFVYALRQPTELDRLKAFLSWALPSTVLPSVVAAELTAGARTPAARKALDEHFLAPFERRGRIIAPSAAAWRRAGAVMARSGSGTTSASRLNDILLAAQAREHGWTVVSRDGDIRTLRAQITGLKVAAPFPARP